MALRRALGEHPDIAFLAALHALTLRVFYRYAQDTCLEVDLKTVGFSGRVPGLADSASVTALDTRHAAWVTALPGEPGDLWDTLADFDGDSRQALFAHCVSLSVNAIYEPYNRRPKALAHADRLAQAIDLDMVAAGWIPTVESYLGRVTKVRILAAVHEAKGERASARVEHLKKVDMAEAAQDLLAGSSWLPDPLRTPGRTPAAATDKVDTSSIVETETDLAAHAMAAE